jgi:hypothetical protein
MLLQTSLCKALELECNNLKSYQVDDEAVEDEWAEDSEEATAPGQRHKKSVKSRRSAPSARRIARLLPTFLNVSIHMVTLIAVYDVNHLFTPVSEPPKRTDDPQILSL